MECAKKYNVVSISGRDIELQLKPSGGQQRPLDTIVICEMEAIKCTVEDLDDIKANFGFEHFTVRNGKAEYHLVHLPDNSVGLYYALRVGKDGLEGRRALEPGTEITCWVRQKITDGN